MKKKRIAAIAISMAVAAGLVAPGFPLLIRDMCTRNIHSLLPMPAMKIFLSFMRTTEPRSRVWLILMSFLRTV